MSFCRELGVTGMALVLFALILFTAWQRRQLSQARMENEDLQRQLAAHVEAQPVSQPPLPPAREELESAHQEQL